MAGRKTSVQINADLIRSDIERMGITAIRVSRAMGKNDNYLATILSKGSATEPVIHDIEMALYQEPGRYICATPDTEEPPTSIPPEAEASIKALYGLIDKLNAIEDAIPEDKTDILFERMQNLEGVMRTTNTWLSRLYAVWTNREEAQGQA